jgi:hypothetical protein
MKTVDPNLLIENWPERERAWAGELGRVRLGVEPIPEQLGKYRRVTWAITVVAGWMAVFIAALFAAFKSPGTGLIVSGVLFGPVILSAWLGYGKMEARALAYLREKEQVEKALGGKPTKLDPEF